MTTRNCHILLLLALCLAAVSSSARAQGALPPAAQKVSIDCEYEAPGAGHVSLALFDDRGVLRRTLLAAQPVQAGKHKVVWDGTTDLGLAAEPGRYTPKGVFFSEPPKIDYLLKVGKSGNPPWRTLDGKGDWGGNLGLPSGIAASDDTVFLTWTCVEDNQITGVQQVDGDGNVIARYYTFYPWDQRMAAAMEGRSFYLGIYNDSTKKPEIAVYNIGEPRGKILARLEVQPTKTRSGRWKGRPTSWLDGLAVKGDVIYASVAYDNKLFVVDRKTGATRDTCEVPSPRGLAVAGDRLLLVSGDTVIALKDDGTLAQTLVPPGLLKHPNCVVAAKDGTFYVGDSGATVMLDPESSGGTQQVFVFDSSGKLLRKIGREGGSPRSGQFQEDGFGDITGLALGPAGKLWVHDVVTGFHRTSRWSTDGKLERQWFSRRIQHVADMVDPGMPSEVLSVSNMFHDAPGICAYRINLESRTWEPAWGVQFPRSWGYDPAHGVYASHDHPGNPFHQYDDKTARWPIFDVADPSTATHGGRRYMLSGAGNGDGSIIEYSADKPPRPVALIGYHRCEPQPDGTIKGFYDQGPNNWFTWADRDGDGRMSKEETVITADPQPLQPALRVSKAVLKPDMSIAMMLLMRDGNRIELRYATLPMKEMLPNGSPVYDWAALQLGVPLELPVLDGGDGKKKIDRYEMDIPVESGTCLYTIVDPVPTDPLRLPGIDGDGWWAGRNWRKKLASFDKATGKLNWAVGRRAPGRAERGQMYNPIMLAGEAGNALFVADAMAVVWVWDTRGLYLGRLYSDTGMGIFGPDTVYMEQQGTAIYQDPKSGRIYSIANDTGAFVHEVKLPERTPLLGPQVTLTPGQAQAVEPWDPDGLAPTEKPTINVHRTAHKVVVNGDLDDREGWGRLADGTRRPGMLVLLDGQRLAEVRAMYDAKNLYLAYEVAHPGGWANAGSELPHSPFVSGAYVDFSIAPNWNQPQRNEVLEGDVRVILARVRNGAAGPESNFQQGYWQKKAAGTNPQDITSPAAKVHFDDIASVPGLEVAYLAKGHDTRTGNVRYSVEVAVPLASLELSDVAGRSIGFDASVGAANAAGDQRERAAHWAGLSEGRVVDRPGSAVLLPHTWGTMTFVRE